MGRTQIRAKQLLDRNLTGASFHPQLKVYDETNSYNIDDIVWFAGKIYKAKQSIPSASEGDLSNSPISNSNNWIDITYEYMIKQRDVNISNVGDVFSIQLNNPNSDIKKMCSIIKYNPPQTDSINPIANFDPSEDLWEYDNNWVEIDGTLHLKNSMIYPMTKYNNGNIDIYEKSINSNNYEDIGSIKIIISN